MVGEKATAYKDGKSLERERARHSNELTQWRVKIFKRDGFTCKKCGSQINLHAHHIKEWAHYPEFRFDISNGITLCNRCHGKIHNKNFTNKRIKQCKKCGTKITGQGKSGLCRSCSIIEWHHQRKSM